jgi:hypothetical protein
MLAQKLALELFEFEALATANHLRLWRRRPSALSARPPTRWIGSVIMALLMLPSTAPLAAEPGEYGYSLKNFAEGAPCGLCRDRHPTAIRTFPPCPALTT